jgi:DNA primase
MSGRMVIPIHNEMGELVAYAGRAIDGSEPRYKLPAGFKKSLELFNLHRAVAGNEERSVVIVEGFFDCMKVHQAGFPAIALMGSSLSQKQEDLLAKHFRMAWLLLDGDDAGQGAADDCLARLAQRTFVRLVRLEDGRQPDSLSADEINFALKYAHD